MDRETLFNEFHSAKPERRISTTREYSNRLSRLASDLNLKELRDLDDVELIMNHLEKKRKQSKTGSSCMTSNVLCSIMEYIYYKEGATDLYEQYRKLKTANDSIYTKKQKSGTFLGNQAENLITKDELMNYCDVIDECCCDTPTNEYMNLRLMLNLLINHPSRNEYATLQFIKYRDFKKLKDLNDNYLVIPSGKPPFLSISDYKTSDKYHTKTTPINDLKTKKMIRTQLKQNGFTSVFQKNDGSTYTPTDMSQLMTRYSQKHLQKNISSTLIYKIVNQDLGIKFNEALDKNDLQTAVDSMTKLSENARTRGHSTKIQQDIYLKT